MGGGGEGRGGGGGWGDLILSRDSVVFHHVMWTWDIAPTPQARSEKISPKLGHTKLICCCSGPTYPKFSKSEKKKKKIHMFSLLGLVL